MTFSYSNKTKHYLLVFFALGATLFLGNTAHATTYYVATNGNDSNPGTNSQPLRTIKEGVRGLSAGDTLFVKSGTYAESIRTGQVSIPNGTSWNNPITVAVNPGDTVTIKPLPNNAFFWILDGQRKFLVIKGFTVDGSNTALHGFKFEGGTQYVRVIDTEIKRAKNSGILVSGSGNTFHEFRNLNVHHNGSLSFDHGIYITTGRNVVDLSEIHQNKGYGLHVYGGSNTASNNIVRNSSFHDNNTGGTWGCGLMLSSGTGNVAFNNIAFGNFSGLCIQNRSTSSRLYNNISYNNDIYGIYMGGSQNNGSRAENNTIYNNRASGIFTGDGATNATVKNNIVRSNPINLQLTATNSSNNLQSDPLFVNVGAKNFHIKAGSPAIDAGVSISGITTDFEGTSRPQGTKFDIGAYEFKNGSGGSSGGSSGGNTGGSSGGSSGGSTGGSSGGSSGGSTGGSSGGSTGSSLIFPASISSPAPGATLTNNSVKFTGRHASGDVFHSLWVGTSKGGRTLFSSPISNHSQLVSGLPSQGTIYVRYWSTNSSNSSDPNAWKFTDQTYTMAVGSTGTSSGGNTGGSSGGSSGGSTGGSSGGSSGGNTGGNLTFPASMSSPAPSTTLTSPSVTFTGKHAPGDVLHSLWVGTTRGGRTLFSGQIANHRQTVSSLPSQGTIYVRYWSTNGGSSSDPNAWKFTDQTYTMAVGGTSTSSGGNSGGTSGSGETFPPVMNSPVPSTTLTSTSITFTGKHAPGDVFHSLWVGTTKGSNNLSIGPIFNHTKRVSGLPTRGTIYVRYWSTNSGNSSDPNAWFFTDQTYTMNAGGN